LLFIVFKEKNIEELPVQVSDTTMFNITATAGSQNKNITSSNNVR